MSDTPSRPRRRVNPFTIMLGVPLLVLALAAVYLALAELLHLWPYD